MKKLFAASFLLALLLMKLTPVQARHEPPCLGDDPIKIDGYIDESKKDKITVVCSGIGPVTCEVYCK